MSKHTPGEWVAMKDEGHYSGTFHYVGLTDGSESTIAMVYGANSETTEANTKLIAAAPDMLKALQMLLKEYEDVKMNTPIAFYKVINAAEAAIKKATN